MWFLVSISESTDRSVICITRIIVAGETGYRPSADACHRTAADADMDGGILQMRMPKYPTSTHLWSKYTNFTCSSWFHCAISFCLWPVWNIQWAFLCPACCCIFMRFYTDFNHHHHLFWSFSHAKFGSYRERRWVYEHPKDLIKISPIWTVGRFLLTANFRVTWHKN